MANVKDLIVRGGARVIGKTYLNDTDISGPVSGDYVDETTLTASEDHIPSSQAVLSALSNVSVAVTSTYSSTGTDAVNGTAVAAALNTLSVSAKGGSGSYITTISESGGKISATAAAFPASLPASDTVSTYSSTGTAPVNGKAVKAAIDTLSVAAAGGSGSYITTISETGGKISATAAAFPASLPASDTVSTYSSTGTAPVNGKAVKAAIDTLSVAAAGGATSYITTISESGGKISATAAAVATTYSSTGTTAVSGKSIKAAIDTLSVAAVGGSGSYITTISETGGKISATAAVFPTIPTSLPASDTVSTYSSTGTAPVNGTAVAAALDTLSVAAAGGSGSYITTISESGGKISATAAAFPASLPASDTVSTYSSTGTAPVNGTAVKAALDTLSVASKGGAASYITTISETGGKISATAAAVATTYSSTGTTAVSGKSIKAAIDTLSVAAAGGAASYITTISETGGKISATAAAFPASLPASDTVSTYSSTGTAPVNGTAVKAALDTLSVSSPTASTATSTTFIDTVSQSGGKITATKKTLPTATASVAGITKVGASGGAASYAHTHSDYASTSHTHTSLASSVDAGAANKPVYIADGVPTAATYTTSIHYTTVNSTSTATAFTATVSTLSDLTAYEDGLRVWIYNDVIASASGCTLNINGLGAKPIYMSNAVTSRVTTHWAKTTMYEFMYSSTVVSGGGWIMMTGYNTNTTYSPFSLGFGYGVCSTAAATVAKAVDIGSYTLVPGGIVSIRFTYDVCANATLNIRTRGAKAIYYNNAPITAGIIKAGDTATFIYNGTYYYLIAIDNGSTGLYLSNSTTGNGPNFETLGGRLFLKDSYTDVTGINGKYNIINASLGPDYNGEAYVEINGNNNIVTGQISDDDETDISIDGNSNFVSGSAHADVRGNNNIVTGTGNYLKGDNSLVVGSANKVLSSDSLAVGWGTKANYDGSLSVGLRTEAVNRPGATTDVGVGSAEKKVDESYSTYMDRLPERAHILTNITVESLADYKGQDATKLLYGKANDMLNVRAQTDLSSTVVKVLTAGEWFEITDGIVSGNNSWWKVVVSTSETTTAEGYVISAFTSYPYRVAYDAISVGGSLGRFGLSLVGNYTPTVIRSNGDILTDGAIGVSAFHNPENNDNPSDSDFAFFVGNSINEGRFKDLQDSSGYKSASDGASITAGITYSGDAYLKNSYMPVTSGTGSPLISVMSELKLLHDAITPRRANGVYNTNRYVDIDLSSFVTDNRENGDNNNIFAYLVTLVRWTNLDDSASMFLFYGVQNGAFGWLKQIFKGANGPAAAYTVGTKKLSVDYGTPTGGGYSVIPLISAHMATSALDTMKSREDKNLSTDASSVNP